MRHRRASPLLPSKHDAAPNNSSDLSANTAVVPARCSEVRVAGEFAHAVGGGHVNRASAVLTNPP